MSNKKSHQGQNVSNQKVGITNYPIKKVPTKFGPNNLIGFFF
jgi:hypothetical protein